MVLVDTSVWIDHLRSREPEMATLEEGRQIFMHPMVIGELACGNLADRNDVLRYLARLPRIVVATDDEVLFFIEHHRIMGSGIGYVDAHLLTASVLHGATQVWTRDRRMMAVADGLGIGFAPNG